MLVDGDGDPGIFPLDQRILTTHDSLQLRKLVDHAGFQVALGQQRGAVDQRPDLRIEGGGQTQGQFAKAHHLLVAGAELGLVDHALEGFEAGLQLDLLIFAVKEHGVGEAGAQHPLVAPHHHTRVFGPGVGDGDEARQQLAVAVDQGEIALMLAHGGDQQFPRQGQVLLFEGAAEGSRVFHQIADLVEQFLIRIDGAAGSAGRLGNACGNQLPPPGRRWNDEVALGLGQPALHPGHSELSRSHEAMALRGIAALQIAEGKGDHRTAVEGDDPVHRSGETDIEVLPAHGFFEGDGGDQPWQHLRQQFGRGAPLHDLGEVEIGPLVGLHLGEIGHLDAVGAGETKGGLGRLALGIEGDLDRGTGQGQFLALLLGGHLGHGNGDTARGGEGCNGAEADAGRFQLLAQQPLQIGHGQREKTGGDFFGTYFKKKFSGHI